MTDFLPTILLRAGNPISLACHPSFLPVRLNKPHPSNLPWYYVLFWAIALLPVVSPFLKLPNPNQDTGCQLGPPKRCGIMPPLCCIYVSKWYLTVFNLWSTIISKSFSAQVISEPWCPVVCIWFCLKSSVLLLSPFSCLPIFCTLSNFF